MHFHLPPRIDELERELRNQPGIVHFRANHAAWTGCNRPYYKCYPPFITAIERLNVSDLDADLLKLPGEILEFKVCDALCRAICVRFPKGSEPTIMLEQELKLRCLIICMHQISLKMPIMCVTCFGDRLCCFERVLKPDRKLILDVFATRFPDKSGVIFLARIAAAVGLLSTGDSTFINRDVLVDDQHKYDCTVENEELRRRLESRAEKRGVLGWSLGKQLEAVPHFRRPHLAMRWTGKGRTNPRLVAVRAVVVKPQAMKKIPTGFINEQGMELESPDAA